MICPVMLPAHARCDKQGQKENCFHSGGRPFFLAFASLTAVSLRRRFASISSAVYSSSHRPISFPPQHQLFRLLILHLHFRRAASLACCVILCCMLSALFALLAVWTQFAFDRGLCLIVREQVVRRPYWNADWLLGRITPVEKAVELFDAHPGRQ